jgi:hypothetical protein
MKNYYSYTISCLILLCFFAPLYAVEKNRPGDVSLLSAQRIAGAK